MRPRTAPVVLVGAGAALLCAVNLAAAQAPSAQPQGRVPFVDPFVRSSAGPRAPEVPPDAAALPSESDAGQTPVPSAPGPSAAAAELVSRPATVATTRLPQSVDEWVTSAALATGIPARAVRAYGDATLEITAEDPACHLGWTTIAGIGWIESGHGTHGGATLGEDGRPSRAIVGPALDGAPGVAAIRSTEQSLAWHGDPVWDHAVGPMQFLPSTWARWGADGDNDGSADPQDIDDAALSTARYLCAGARDLSTGDGWHAAVLSYNHAEPYVTSVFTQASAYAAAARQ